MSAELHARDSVACAQLPPWRISARDTEHDSHMLEWISELICIMSRCSTEGLLHGMFVSTAQPR